MKRSANSLGDSLDLLLDTICNTFGGVIFISLLVVILLNMTSETASVTPPTEKSHSTLVEQEERHREQRARLETLTKAVEQQQESIGKFVEPGTEELVREQQRLAAAHASLAEEQSERTLQISQAQIEVNETARRMQTVSESVAAANRELNAVKEELGQEVAVRSRAAKLPKQRRTTKTPVPFLLKEGHLCAYVQVATGGQLTVNSHEAEVRTDAEGDYVVPRVANGLKITANRSNTEAIRSKFSGFNKQQHFITIVVWADSFKEFTAVKDVIVAEGFEYRLVPFSNNDKVRIGATADPGLVQ